MATIPTYVGQQNRLETGNVVQFPQGGGPIGAAVENAGNALSNVGERLNNVAYRAQREQERLDNFELQRQSQLLDLDLDAALEAAKQKMPADGKGFHDAFVGQLDPNTGRPIKPGLLDERLKEYREKLPESVRGKFDDMAPLYRKDLSNKTAKIEYAQRQNYYSVEVKKMLGNLENSIVQTDADDKVAYETFRKNGEAAITATGLPDLEKQVLLDRWGADAAEASWRALQAKDPQRALAALGFGPKPQAETGSSAAKLIKNFEGYRSKPYRDVNALRTGYGSDTVTRADGSVHRVGSSTMVTRADADRDLERRIGETQSGIVGKVGQDAWNRLDEPTKAALTSVAYNYGSLPTRIVGAVQGGNKGEISQAVARLGMDNGGVNRKRRAQEAAIIAGREAVPSGVVFETGAAPDPQFQNIPADRRLILASAAETDINQQQSAASAAIKLQSSQRDDEINLGIESGSIVHPNQIINDPYLDDGQKATRLKQFREKNDDLMAQSAFADALGSDKYIDATDPLMKKGANQLFKSLGGPEAFVKNDPNAVGLGFMLYDKGMVPDGFKNGLEAMLRSHNSVLVAQGLQYGESLETKNPYLFKREFTDDFKNQVADYRSKLAYGTPADATSSVMKMNDPAQKQLQAERLKTPEGKKIDDITFNDVANKLFDPSYIPFNQANAPVSQGTADELTGDTKRVLKDEYAKSGDLSDAWQRTAQKVMHVWGPSVANGGRLMKYAPELAIEPVDGSHEWMRPQIEHALIERGLASEPLSTPKGMAPAVPYDHYLVPSPKTAIEFEHHQNPSYNVVVQTPNGEWMAVTGKDGVTPLEWRFDRGAAASAASILGAKENTNYTAEKQRLKDTYAPQNKTVDEFFKPLPLEGVNQ